MPYVVVYPEDLERTQVIKGTVNMGYIMTDI